jgi:hypothetical protein
MTAPGEDTFAVAALTCSVSSTPVAPAKAYGTRARGVTTCTWVLDGKVTLPESSRCCAKGSRDGAAALNELPGHDGMAGSRPRCPGTG